MELGAKVFEDNISDMEELPSDFYEITARSSYEKQGQKKPETKLEAFDSIKKKIVGVHGSMLREGVNLMNQSRDKQNRHALEFALEAANRFDAKYVVFHPGYIERGREEECSISNLVSLIKDYDDPRLFLEVVPLFGWKERHVFPIWHVNAWKRLQDKTGKRILVDTGHAAITARALKLPTTEYVSGLIKELNSEFIHLADNDLRGDCYEDSHLHIGKGKVPNAQVLDSTQDIVKYCLIELGNIDAQDINTVRSYLR